MSLHEAEAQKQIQQMVDFIMNEARDKVQEIEAKALEDFNIEKLKLVQQKKDQVRQEYQTKAKRMETERAIARSNAVNKCRLRKIGARNAVIDEVTAGALHHLAKLSTENPDSYQRLVVDLLTQGALMLLEKEIFVRARPEDSRLVSQCLSAAEQQFSQIVQAECGVNIKVKMVLDPENPLPPGPKDKSDSHKTCAGGIVVTSTNRKIVVDNTLDARLRLVVHDCLPEVRKLLFPVQ